LLRDNLSSHRNCDEREFVNFRYTLNSQKRYEQFESRMKNEYSDDASLNKESLGDASQDETSHGQSVPWTKQHIGQSIPWMQRPCDMMSPQGWTIRPNFLTIGQNVTTFSGRFVNLQFLYKKNVKIHKNFLSLAAGVVGAGAVGAYWKKNQIVKFYCNPKL
jgi:hypothetical protein